MSDASIPQHKRMAMGETVPLAKGKAVIQKYAKGGAVMSESKVANLPARGGVYPVKKATGEKIATFKKGGGVGLTIIVGVPKPMKKPRAR